MSVKEGNNIFMCTYIEKKMIKKFFTLEKARKIDTNRLAEEICIGEIQFQNTGYIQKLYRKI